MLRRVIRRLLLSAPMRRLVVWAMTPTADELNALMTSLFTEAARFAPPGKGVAPEDRHRLH